MTAPSTPPPWLLATRRRNSYTGMRISDAERADVADLLSKHYGDGRLDQAEFNQRLDQAMRAKTYADLGGLFADLPRTEEEAVEGPKFQGRRGGRSPLATLILAAIVVVVAAVIVGHVLTFSLGPLVWLAILAVIAYAILHHRKS
jgi:Flp pilus assembly protein TadB